MLTNVKNKSLVFLVFILLFAMLLCIMSITVFAADEGTTSSSEMSAFEKWWDSYNQIVGYCVAGVIFVAMVIVIYLWIPKDKDKKKKPSKKKA